MLGNRRNKASDFKNFQGAYPQIPPNFCAYPLYANPAGGVAMICIIIFTYHILPLVSCLHLPKDSVDHLLQSAIPLCAEKLRSRRQ